MSQSPTSSAEYIQFIARTYLNDFNGYRSDILGMRPADWQDRVGESLMANKRTAVSAGHGIGKTAFLAAAIHWFAATRPRFAIVATASTEDQLQKKLWRELAKVNDGARNREWFTWKERTFTRFGDPTAQAVALPNNENNPGAFAGTHEDHVLGVFDEGADIPRSIYQVFNGAMTTAGARWIACSNPRSASGFFYDAVFGKYAARRPGDTNRGLWQPFVIPSTESPFVHTDYERDMALTAGVESDEYRVQVLGLPPRFDSQQFIPREFVTKAMERSVKMFARWPLVLGVDVGHVNDRSTIVPRRGRKVLDAIRVVRGERTTDFARRIAEEIRFYREEHGLVAQAVIEEIGMGVGVVETLEDMGFADQVWGINTGTAATETELYSNLRCEMWALTKEWLEGDVELPNNADLNDDLTSVKRKPSGSNNKLRLETKDEMRRRGARSPDIGDALALTFAVPFDLLPERHGDMWRDDYREPATAGSWMGR